MNANIKVKLTQLRELKEELYQEIKDLPGTNTEERLEQIQYLNTLFNTEQIMKEVYDSKYLYPDVECAAVLPSKARDLLDSELLVLLKLYLMITFFYEKQLKLISILFTSQDKKTLNLYLN